MLAGMEYNWNNHGTPRQPKSPLVTAAFFIFNTKDASTRAISDEEHNALASKYNRDWGMYAHTVELYNKLVTKTNKVIERYNFFANETSAHVKDYYAVRQQVYDTFSLGRAKTRLDHPYMAVPKPCGEKDMEKYAEACEHPKPSARNKEQNACCTGWFSRSFSASSSGWHAASSPKQGWTGSMRTVPCTQSGSWPCSSSMPPRRWSVWCSVP